MKNKTESEPKQRCTSCGYYGQHIGRIRVECCSRCNTDWDLGECQICKGTGWVVDPDASNREIIKRACELSGGYLCGMG